jgi:hypothetical protein
MPDLPPAPDLAKLLGPLAATSSGAGRLPILDEVDLFEQGGLVFYENASYYFRTSGCRQGRYCFEAQLEGPAQGRVVFEPRYLRLAGRHRLSFAYRKTNPRSRLWFGLVTPGGKAVVACEGGACRGGGVPVASKPVWTLASIDLAAAAAAQGVRDVDRVSAVFFGLYDAEPGDSLFLDAAQAGEGAPAGGAVSLAGRLTEPRANVPVVLLVKGVKRQTTTAPDGSFRFSGLKRGDVVELWAEIEGRRCFSVAGDVIHVPDSRDDAHIVTQDVTALRGAGIEKVKPEWSNYTGPGLAEYATQFPPHKAMFYTGVIGNPLEYSAHIVPNRFGAYDRDHRFENPDRLFRILLLGDCIVEGLQSELYQRIGPRLESILRRRYGLDVEVITLAHSNGHPAAAWPLYDKLGRLFRPDLVLLDVNAPSIVQMEPRLLRSLTGWDPQHSAYTSAELTSDGQLKMIPPDPNYPVYAVKPAYTNLKGDVPPNWALHLREDAMPEEGREVARILKAVLALYVRSASDLGSRVAVFTGSRALNYATPQTFKAGAASQDVFASNVSRWAREADVESFDISPSVLSHERNGQLSFWKRDGHLTPLGHLWVAEGVAQALVSGGAFKPPKPAARVAGR